MPPEQQQQRPRCNPPEVLLKLVLVATHSHFETPGILDEKRMANILHSGKKVMEKSQRDAEARYVKLCVLRRIFPHDSISVFTSATTIC